MVKYFLLKLFVIFIYVVSHIYDYISYPVYWVYYHPWRIRRYRQGDHSKLERQPDALIYSSLVEPGKLNVEMARNSIQTVLDVFNYIVTIHGDKDCLGTRQFISEDSEVQPNGKVFKKYNLGSYSFISFNELGEQAETLSKGLLSLGFPPGTRIAVLAETRQEWIISTFAAYKNNFTIVTLYTNLGEDGIIHGLSETEVPIVICTHETLDKVKNVLPSTPSVRNVIVIESQYNHVSDLKTRIPSNVRAVTYNNLIEIGCNNYDMSLPPPPKREDPAIIMYTSGSTGKPKGVVLSHESIVFSINSLVNVANFRSSDKYIGFLPLAHVLELQAEISCLLYGIKIGYSSPLTLTNKSSKIKQGCKGDANVLKPTLICSVPLILERIYKSVVDTMKRQGWAAEELFHYFVQYKMKWQDRGFDTPMLNKTLFRKIRYFLGGKVRLMLSGGAPLSPDTHSLTRTCICVPVIQGYGLTETCASGTVSSVHDRTTGRAGAPLYNIKIKLVDWKEGNYLITDRPSPRGEIHIGGDNVALGYFKNPEKTAEDFYTDSDGIRWFRTGDIGIMGHDGVLSIIDRKKDLVKLQHGEYVSYGKIEAILKTCPIVDNICAYADSTKNTIMCVVIPDETKLSELTTLPLEQAVVDPTVVASVLKRIVDYGKSNGLLGFEVPSTVLLFNDEWTPDSGLVTAAFKLRRRMIVEKYAEKIKAIY